MSGVVILILVLVFVFCYVMHKKGNSENFKVLGELANQKALYYRCLYECERGDPDKYLTKTKGSMACQEYCDSVITDIVRRGGPSYPFDVPSEPVAVFTPIDKSYEKCGSGTHGNRCRELESTNSEIKEKCRQECEYSTLSNDQCMSDCFRARSSSKSRGWSWK